jgi:hypothetical protein
MIPQDEENVISEMNNGRAAMMGIYRGLVVHEQMGVSMPGDTFRTLFCLFILNEEANKQFLT